MENRRKVLRQLMLIFRNLESDDVELKELETIYKDGSVTGFKIELATDEKPRLRLVEEEQD